MSKLIIILLCLALAACRDARFHPREMELWYWHHSYVTTPEAVASSKALIDQAVRAGYTGMAMWDSSWTFLDAPSWNPENITKLKEVVNYAAAHGLKVMAIVAPYGSSNDLLKQHPEWAEAQRVVGTRFRVDDAGHILSQIQTTHIPIDATPLLFLEVHVPVEPWHQYHVHLAVRTIHFKGLAQLEVNEGPANRLDANLRPRPDQDWTPLDYTFNSAESSHLRLAAGIFGPHEGELEVGQFTLEETALVYVIRGDGTPLRIYDPDHPATQFEEGRDVNPIHDQKLLRTPEFSNDNYHDPGPVTLPATTRLRPGQVVAIDYYAVVPVYDEFVSVCLTEPKVEQWVIANAKAARALLPANSSLLLSHDEIRQMNSCALCRSRNQNAGELLAAHIRALTAKLQPLAPLYIWSDMFDPLHNARDHYYQVEGSLTGSWKGLPENVTVMNWNLEHLHESLLWFSGDDPRQPTPHRQIIAGFYDPADHDGAAAARKEWTAASGIPGVTGMMYTTWNNDYTQLQPFANSAREGWAKYRDARPR